MPTRELLSIANTPLFAGLSYDVVAPLQAACRSKVLEKGEILFHQNSEGSEMYIIESGRVRIWIETADGRELNLAEFGQHEVIGELEMIDGKPRSAGAQALERTYLFVLPREALFTVLGQNPGLAVHMMTILSERLRQNNKAQLAQRGISVLTSRLARFLLLMGEAAEWIPVHRERAAQLLNADSVLVDDLLHKWQVQGLLGFRDDGHVSIKNHAGLEELANWA